MPLNWHIQGTLEAPNSHARLFESIYISMVYKAKWPTRVPDHTTRQRGDGSFTLDKSLMDLSAVLCWAEMMQAYIVGQASL